MQHIATEHGSPRIPVPAPTEFADVITTANSRLRAPLTTLVVKEPRRRNDSRPPSGEPQTPHCRRHRREPLDRIEARTRGKRRKKRIAEFEDAGI